MPEQDPTRIGKVRHVQGATVTVALDADLAGIAPIYRGRLQPVGQIGSLVRIPQGLVDLVATVSMVGIRELSGPVQPVEEIQHDERWLQIELLGEIDLGTKQFQRGVSSYPNLDDPVHFAAPEQLKSVFPPPGEQHLQLGHLAAAEDVPVCINVSPFVVRHAAIVGSTGSGKTSAIASLLQNFTRCGWGAANIIVVDPHGEYASAMGDGAAIKSVLDTGGSQLRVPFWALPATEILRVFTGTATSGTAANRFAELVKDERQKFTENADWLKLDPANVTADTPVPFDIKQVWYTLDTENRMTLQSKADSSTACYIDRGDSDKLRPAQFEPYGPGSTPPNKGPDYGKYGSTPDLLRLGLRNPRLRFFLQPKGQPKGDDPLVGVVQDWLGGERPISVFDFSGVPAIATDLAIGVVLNLIFEVALRCNFNDPGIGRPSPVLIVLEEAHRYLGKDASALTRDSANRIAREGRKYGVGIALVSQRPTELPDTALAQCGTLISLRLSNADDQGTVRSALPDAISNLASVLPSLRTGEGIVSGEATILPARFLFDCPDPKPLADDPSLDAWREVPKKAPDVSSALRAWRGIYEATDND